MLFDWAHTFTFKIFELSAHLISEISANHSNDWNTNKRIRTWMLHCTSRYLCYVSNPQQVLSNSFPPRLSLNFKSQPQWTLIEHAAQHHTKPRHAQNYMHETQAHKHENNHHIAHVITNCAINTNFCPLSKLTATVVPTNQTTTPHSHTCQLLYRTNTIIRWALLQWQCMREYSHVTNAQTFNSRHHARIATSMPLVDTDSNGGTEQANNYL